MERAQWARVKEREREWVKGAGNAGEAEEARQVVALVSVPAAPACV